MTFSITRAAYDQALAVKTLSSGRIYTGVMVLILAFNIFVDRWVFDMFDSIPFRLSGIIPLSLFFIGSLTFLKKRSELIIPLYIFAMLGLMVLFSWGGYHIFTRYPTPFHISSYLIGLAMTMFICTWMALGAQRMLPWIVFGAMIFLNFLLLSVVPSIQNFGYLLAINILGTFTIIFNYQQDKIGFVRFKNEKLLQQKQQELNIQKQELEVLNKDLESFNYFISHDLKTPLRNVNSFIQLLLKKIGDQDDKDINDYIGFINNGLKNMADLIDGLVVLSKIGNKKVVKDQLELEPLFLKHFHELQLGNDASDPKVEMNLNKLPKIYGSSLLIGQAISNLLSNAIKYSSKGEKPIIDVSYFDHPDYHVIGVRDNGIGFDEKYAESLFVPFKRLHSSGKYEGVGLGLSIVERIIRLHGGKVWAKSNEGQGATFFFSLPFKTDTENMAFEADKKLETHAKVQ